MLLPREKLDRAHSKLAEHCKDLINRIRRVNPTVIDHFLSQQHEDVQKIGKFLIAWEILECEAIDIRGEEIRASADTTRSVDLDYSHKVRIKELHSQEHIDRNDWYRFLLNHLVSGIDDAKDIFKNKLDIITFNYDVSLEYHLHRSLSAIHIFNEVDKVQFASDLVTHVYGSTNDDFLNKPEKLDLLVPRLHQDAQESEQRLMYYKNLFDSIYRVSQRILTISPKPVDQNVLKKLKQAKHIYILGYGFDEINNEKLNLRANLRGKNVYFTNYDDKNKINKIVSKLLLNNQANFFMKEPLYQEVVFLYEKSTRKVYEALERDLELPAN